MEAKNHVVQQPHSDTIVPETQLEHNGHFTDFTRGLDNESGCRGVHLSPNSVAVLKHNTATKKSEAPESAPFTVRLLSKKAFGLDDSSASSNSLPFSFGQARKAPRKTPPREEVATPHSAIQASLTLPTLEQCEEQPSNGKAHFISC
jgi:hypothetical protein